MQAILITSSLLIVAAMLASLACLPAMRIRAEGEGVLAEHRD